MPCCLSSRPGTRGLIALPLDKALAIFSATDAGDFVMAGFAQALQFGVGVAIILYGVRTVLGELVPAFQGIAEKVVPGAKPALDIPIVFPFGANAVLIGFLSSFAGGLLALGILALWLNPVFGLSNSTFGDADFGWFRTLIGLSLRGGTAVGAVLTILIAVALVTSAIIFQLKVVDAGWIPGAKRDAWIAAEKLAEAEEKAAAKEAAQKEPAQGAAS